MPDVRRGTPGDHIMKVGLPPCWLPGWDNLSTGEQQKVYKVTRQEALTKLATFREWLESYWSMAPSKSKRVARQVWVAWVYSNQEPVEWLRDLTYKITHQWIHSMRLWCRWVLSTPRPNRENWDTATEMLPELDKLYRLAKGEHNRDREVYRQNRPLDPLTASEIIKVEDAIEESLSHPQYPWAKYILKAAFTTALPVNAMMYLTREDIEGMLARWKAGGSPAIGMRVNPQGRGARTRPGRKRLYPANWTMKQFEGLLDLPTRWQCLAHVVLPRIPNTRFASDSNCLLAGKTVAQRLVEVIGPLVVEMRDAPRLMTYEPQLHALLVTTTQARLIRELDDWATAAQLRDWSIPYLQRLPWAQEAYQGPAQDSVWNTQLNGVCHTHPRRRKRTRG